MQLAVRITLASTSPVPAYTGGPFASGVAQMDTGAGTGWTSQYLVACGSLGERVDIATGGNYGQLLDTQVSIANFDKWYATFQAAGASLNGALVEVGEWLSSIAITPRWTGNVVDASFEGANVECRVENILGTRHKLVPARALSVDELPNLNATSDGVAVPLVVGSVSDLTPPSLSTSKSYYTALSLVKADNTAIARDQSFVTAASTSTTATVAAEVRAPLSTATDFWLDTIWYIQVSLGTTVYVEIVSGPGSGQTRKITPFSTSAITTTTLDGSSTKSYSFSITTPWDTLPTTASGVKFCAQTTSAVLTVADEATVSSVTATENGNTSTIAFVQGSTSGIVTADISAEFLNGENYKSVLYVRPSNNYGVSALSDGLCASAGATISIFDNSGVVLFIEYDIFCRGRIDTYDIPQAAIDGASDVYLMAAFDASAAKDPLYPIYGQVIAYGWDGTVETVAISATYPVSGLSKSFNEITSGVVNTYSNSILPDGTGGYFSAYALKMPAFAKPLAAYEYIRFGVAMRTKATTSSTGIFFPNQAVWTNGSNTITGPINPAVGSWIRPGSPFDTTNQEYMGTRFIDPVTGFHGGLPEDWRQVSSSTPTGGGNYSVVFSGAAWAGPTGLYDTVNTATFYTVTQYESGLAFTFGDITPASQFRVSTSSGRKFSASWPALPSGKSNGDPILLARDAVLDMYYRDLGLGAASVDFASFQALPADPIHSAIVSRVDSAQRVADLCQQFNWVVGHAADGKETAYAWLSRVGTTAYDLSIDTGDIVEGSLTGIALSDIQDLCNLPNVQWDWTQADGYRQSSNVIDVKADPSVLTSSNYLQYLTGFGDFSTSLAVYQAFHASYQLSNYQRSATFELPDVGTDPGAVLWPLVGMSRFDWMASRKPIYKMLIPDTSSAAGAIVGQRVRLRHKRYTAGAWVYGTVVEWELDPMTAEYSIVIMGDPTALPTGATLYIDTLDPTATVPQYIDVLDGVSTQYIDHLGA